MYAYLRDCQDIEELAGRVYGKLAEHKNLNNELRKEFLKLSRDERLHAQNIALFLQSPLENLKPLARVSLEMIQTVKIQAEECLHWVEQENLTEIKALQLSIQMERNFAKVHIQNVVQLDNPAMLNLFEKLHADDQAHIATLNAMLKNRTTD